jgi:hypothetical protein
MILLRLIDITTFIFHRKKIISMKVYLSHFLAALSIVTFPTHRSNASLIRSSFVVRHHESLALANRAIVTRVSRGGSQELETGDVAEVLYLPGLLETSVVKHSKVCSYIDISELLKSKNSHQPLSSQHFRLMSQYRSPLLRPRS